LQKQTTMDSVLIEIGNRFKLNIFRQIVSFMNLILSGKRSLTKDESPYNVYQEYVFFENPFA
jgi:hypothetical protein